LNQGLPVIYTKGQGFDEQFQEGMVGYHVDCFNAEEIANRIIDMSNNYEVLSKNCTKLYSKFDWQIISKNYRKLYGDVCCEK